MPKPIMRAEYLHPTTTSDIFVADVFAVTTFFEEPGRLPRPV
jgi:hypothetical protein